MAQPKERDRISPDHLQLFLIRERKAHRDTKHSELAELKEFLRISLTLRKSRLSFPGDTVELRRNAEINSRLNTREVKASDSKIIQIGHRSESDSGTYIPPFRER